MAKLLSRLPERLHHHAYVVKDQEKNRRFFEDVLGIPLTATWCEQHLSPWVNREVAFCHTFYSLGDGGALAFFSFADDEVYQKCQAAVPAEIGAFDHVAFKVDDTVYDEIVSRVKAAGEAVRETDHGYCRSMYLYLARRADRRIHRRSAGRGRDRRRCAAPMHTPSWPAGWPGTTARTISCGLMRPRRTTVALKH